MDNYTQVKVPKQIAAATKMVASWVDFYVQGNTKLVELLYSKGITQQQIADHLGVSKSAVSLMFPKNKKEGVSK